MKGEEGNRERLNVINSIGKKKVDWKVKNIKNIMKGKEGLKVAKPSQTTKQAQSSVTENILNFN